MGPEEDGVLGTLVEDGRVWCWNEVYMKSIINSIANPSASIKVII